MQIIDNDSLQNAKDEVNELSQDLENIKLDLYSYNMGESDRDFKWSINAKYAKNKKVQRLREIHAEIKKYNIKTHFDMQNLKIKAAKDNIDASNNEYARVTKALKEKLIELIGEEQVYEIIEAVQDRY